MLADRHRRLRQHGERGGRARARGRASTSSSPTIIWRRIRCRRTPCRSIRSSRPARIPSASSPAPDSRSSWRRRWRSAPTARWRSNRCCASPASAPSPTSRRWWGRTGPSPLSVSKRCGRPAPKDCARSSASPAWCRPSAPPTSAIRLGPRINAAGRLHRPDEALELLLTRDPARAAALATELDERNRERQTEELNVVEEARRRVLERGALPPIVIEWSPEWHRGVVGIAASRIAREFNRPAVLISIDGATGVGSGRSIRGIHLHQFLSAFETEMVRFGGHAQAIGLEVAADSLPELRARLEASAAAAWPPELLARRYEYELEVAPREVDEALLDRLRLLEPFGAGNPSPLLRVGPLTIEGAPRIFGKGHLDAQARGDDGGLVRLLLWCRGDSDAAPALPERLEVLGQLEWDSFLQAPVLEVTASRPHGAATGEVLRIVESEAVAVNEARAVSAGAAAAPSQPSRRIPPWPRRAIRPSSACCAGRWRVGLLLFVALVALYLFGREGKPEPEQIEASDPANGDFAVRGEGFEFALTKGDKVVFEIRGREQKSDRSRQGLPRRRADRDGARRRHLPGPGQERDLRPGHAGGAAPGAGGDPRTGGAADRDRSPRPRRRRPARERARRRALRQRSGPARARRLARRRPRRPDVVARRVDRGGERRSRPRCRGASRPRSSSSAKPRPRRWRAAACCCAAEPSWLRAQRLHLFFDQETRELEMARFLSEVEGVIATAPGGERATVATAEPSRADAPARASNGSRTTRARSPCARPRSRSASTPPPASRTTVDLRGLERKPARVVQTQPDQSVATLTTVSLLGTFENGVLSARRPPRPGMAHPGWPALAQGRRSPGEGGERRGALRSRARARSRA